MKRVGNVLPPGPPTPRGEPASTSVQDHFADYLQNLRLPKPLSPQKNPPESIEMSVLRLISEVLCPNDFILVKISGIWNYL